MTFSTGSGQKASKVVVTVSNYDTKTCTVVSVCSETCLLHLFNTQRSERYYYNYNNVKSFTIIPCCFYKILERLLFRRMKM